MLRHLQRSTLWISPIRFRVVKKSDRIRTAKVNAQSKNAALPPAAEAKLKAWPKLIMKEVQAAYDSRKANLIDNLTFRSLSYDVFKDLILELNLPPTLTDARFDDIRSTLRIGSWLSVRVAGVHQTTPAVIIEVAVDALQLKLLEDLPVTDLEIQEAKFAVGMNPEIGPHNALIEFWEDHKRLRQLPGWTNFLRAHHALPWPTTSKPKKLAFFCDTLNDSQKEAVTRAMDPKHTILSIQGPPGTGKTAVVVELIRQAVKTKKSVLVLAPSKKALETVMSRMTATLSKESGHLQLCNSDGPLTINDRIKQHKHFDAINEAFNMANRGLSDDNVSLIHQQIKYGRGMRQKIKAECFENTNVLYATTGQSVIRHMTRIGFKPDLIILDEAAHVWECIAWHVSMYSPKVVFVGDQCQLSAVLNSKDPDVVTALGTSVMDHLEKELGERAQVRLKRQYRCNASIIRWSNEVFYDAQLETDLSVRDITIEDLIPATSNQDPCLNKHPLVFVDTSDAGYEFREAPNGSSLCNNGEVKVVVNHVTRLLNAGIKPFDIGVITPYQGQVQRFREQLSHVAGLLISTVDGFQGGEHEVICLSLVRSNSKQAIGFLQDLRRMNVSLTRAKRQLFVVGDSRSLSTVPELTRLLQFFEDDACCVKVRASPQFKKPYSKNVRNKS